MKKIIILLVIMSIGVFTGSPYYTAYTLNQAYKNDEGTVIADSIDYAQLQYNLTTQLSTRLEITMDKYPLINQFAGKALNMSEPFIKTAINGAITHENISTAVSSKGQVNDATKQLAVIWAIATDKVNVTALIKSIITDPNSAESIIKNQIQQKIAEQSSTENIESKQDVKLNYCGINCFKVTAPVKGYSITIHMERESLIQWKIVNVEL